MNMIAPLIADLPANVNPASREGVLAVEAMLFATVPDVQTYTTDEMNEKCPLTHRFADGVYAREIFLPAGTIIVGKIHRFGHLNILTKGKCIVQTEFGIERLEAPCTFISKPGTKRVVGVIEDTVWTTLHGVKPDEYDDIPKIEDRIICPTFADYDRLVAMEDKP